LSVSLWSQAKFLLNLYRNFVSPLEGCDSNSKTNKAKENLSDRNDFIIRTRNLGAGFVINTVPVILLLFRIVTRQFFVNNSPWENSHFSLEGT